MLIPLVAAKRYPSPQSHDAHPVAERRPSALDRVHDVRLRLPPFVSRQAVSCEGGQYSFKLPCRPRWLNKLDQRSGMTTANWSKHLEEIFHKI